MKDISKKGKNLKFGLKKPSLATLVPCGDKTAKALSKTGLPDFANENGQKLKTG